MIYGCDGKFLCFKHGEIKRDEGESLFDIKCPVCQLIEEKDLCRRCEKHKAEVTFSDSVLSSIHGMSERVCRCCYFKQVAETRSKVNENYERLKAELDIAPCG